MEFMEENFKYHMEFMEDTGQRLIKPYFQKKVDQTIISYKVNKLIK